MELENREHYIPIVPLCGAATAVLSAVPFVNCLNCCFFAWVIGGGVLSVKLVSNRTGNVVSSYEGLLVGFLMGLVSGFITASLALTLHLAFNVSNILEMIDLKNEEISEVSSKPWFSLVGSFCIAMFCHPVFGAIGGLLGTYLTGGEGKLSQIPIPASYTAPSQRLDPPQD